MDTQVSVVIALLTKGDLTRAEAELAVLAAMSPDAPVVHTLRGQLLSARSNTPGAAREFDRALALDATNLQALTGRLTLDAKEKRFAEGRSRLSKAIAARPNSSPLLVLAASFENAAGNSETAEQYLRKSIAVDSRNLSAYGMLGQMYLSQNRLEDAKAEYKRMAEKRPTDVGSKTMVGMLLDMQGRPDEAIKVYDEIVKSTPRASVASNNLAYHYATRGEQLTAALQLAQAAKQQMPDSPEVDDTLGFVYYKQNLPNLAIPPLRQASEKDPTNPIYQFHLGLAYAKAGEKDKARQSLEKALKIKPDFEGSDEARSVLASLRS
jgi:tetratricopeptide (TPR) repeat protein